MADAGLVDLGVDLGWCVRLCVCGAGAAGRAGGGGIGGDVGAGVFGGVVELGIVVVYLHDRWGVRPGAAAGAGFERAGILFREHLHVAAARGAEPDAADRIFVDWVDYDRDRSGRDVLARVNLGEIFLSELSGWSWKING